MNNISIILILFIFIQIILQEEKMLPRGYAFVSNCAMLLYVSCWISYYCYQASSYTEADIKNMDKYHTWIILNIAGASCLLLGLLISMAKIAIDQAALGFGALGINLVGWILITVGMGIGSESNEFKEISLDYNIPVSQWCAITGICFQCIFNGYEHTIQEDDATGQPNKQVEI